MSERDEVRGARLPFAPDGDGALKVSFEFFPPRSEKMENDLWNAVKRLEPLAPRFVSVTYGAGGSTRDRTHNTVVRIMRETPIAAAAHLTCVAATRDEVDEVARHYWESGIRHIVALRGDPQEGETVYTPHPGGYAYAADLVAGLRRIADFDNLKRKVDAGASRAITQYFFDVDVYLEFVDRARAAGIDVPIVPGILPVTNFAQIVKFSGMCGASVPAWMADLFAGLDDDPETRKLVAATVAAEQCRALQAAGVNEFHFYTLNRADLAFAICHILGLRPSTA